MQVQDFFDERTCTLSYVVYDSSSQDAIVIDPVLDYNSSASEVFTDSVDRIIHFIEANALNLRMILETHAHADHLSGAQILKERYPKRSPGLARESPWFKKPSRKSLTYPPILKPMGASLTASSVTARRLLQEPWSFK